MHKKLVRYDKWHFTEPDPVRLKRAAHTLREQILNKVAKSEDPYKFHDRTMPFVEAALRGEITHSLDDDIHKFLCNAYKCDKTEGFLPPKYDREFCKAVADFEVTVLGLSLEKPEFLTIDGERYAELDFEDEGDWPGNVKYP